MEFWIWITDIWHATAPLREFLWKQKEWMFSGIGATAVTGAFALVSHRRRENQIRKDAAHWDELLVRLATFRPPVESSLRHPRVADPLTQLPLSVVSKPNPSSFVLQTPTEAERIAFDEEYAELLKNAPGQQFRGVSCQGVSAGGDLNLSPTLVNGGGQRSRFDAAKLFKLFLGSFISILLALYVIERLFG